MIKYLLNQVFILKRHLAMEEFNYKISDSVEDIEKKEWDLIFGDIPEGYDFFKAVEKSNLEQYSFCYILIYKGTSLALIAPLFVTDFNLDIVVEGVIQRLIQAVRKFIPRFFIIKTLFCGSPFGENGILGIRPEYPDKQNLICELTKITGIICKEKNIPFTVFKDFLKEDIAMLEHLRDKGFFMTESFPSVVLELSFNSLEDYFKNLSRNSRKNLRRKIKKAQSCADITVRVCENIEDIIEDVYRLYLNTYNAGKVKFEKLTREFFITAGKNPALQSKFFLYYFGKRLAAFNLCFVQKDTLIDKFIGFDYDIAYKYNLYFFSWCYNIEWCIKNSLRYYQVGQTDYHPKLKLGGQLIPLYAYARHNNPVLNLILRCLAKLLIREGSEKK
jgi:predicted N-acyltransferase